MSGLPTSAGLFRSQKGELLILMKQRLSYFCRDNAWFLLTSVAALVFGFCILVIYGKADSHILLNSFHTPALDIFFKHFTELGGGLPSYIGAAILLVSLRGGLFVLLAQLINLLLTHAIKIPVGAPRPVTYFHDMGLQLPPTVEGVDLHITDSFPSGHTSAAFAFCLCLSAMLPKRWQPLGCVLSLLACLGGYSRVYLSQHFLEDILFGAIIGIISATITYLLLYQTDKIPNQGIVCILRERKKNRKRQ